MTITRDDVTCAEMAQKPTNTEQDRALRNNTYLTENTWNAECSLESTLTKNK